MLLDYYLNQIKKGEVSFKDLDDNLRSNKEIYLLCEKKGINNYKYAIGDDILKDKEIIKKSIFKHYLNFLSIPEEYKKDFLFVKELVVLNQKIYPLLNESFKNNPEIFLCLLNNEKQLFSGEDLLCFLKSSNNLKESKNVFLAFAKNHMSVNYFSESLKQDENLLLSIYEIDTRLIRYFNKNLYNQEKYYALWKQENIENILFFEYKEEHLKDYEFLFFKKFVSYMDFPEEVKNNRKFYINIIKNLMNYSQYCGGNELSAREYNKKCDFLCKNIPENFKKDKEILLGLAKISSDYYFEEALPNNLDGYDEIIKEYIKNTNAVLKEKVKRFIASDKDLALLAANKRFLDISYLSNELCEINFIKQILDINSNYYIKISDEFKIHPEVINNCLLKNENLFIYLPEESKNDINLMIYLTKNNKGFFKEIKQEIRLNKKFIMSFSDYISEKKSIFKEEFLLLLKYEREKDLINSVNEKNVINKKNKL